MSSIGSLEIVPAAAPLRVTIEHSLLEEHGKHLVVHVEPPVDPGTLLPLAVDTGGFELGGTPSADFRGVVEITQAGTADGLVVQAVPTPAGQPLVKIGGTPASDTDGTIEITTAGNVGTARFRWSLDGGGSWLESNVLTAASVPLGATGLVAEFAGGTYAVAGSPPAWVFTPAPHALGALYTWPHVALFRYSTNDGGSFSSPARCSSVPGGSLLGSTIAFPGLQVFPETAPVRHYELARWRFRVRSYFKLAVHQGTLPPDPPFDAIFPHGQQDGVEGWDLMLVGASMNVDGRLYFFNDDRYPRFESKLLQSARWIGEERPPFGTYEYQGGAWQAVAP